MCICARVGACAKGRGGSERKTREPKRAAAERWLAVGAWGARPSVAEVYKLKIHSWAG